MPHVLVQIVQGSSIVNRSAQALLTLLMENRRSKEDMIQFEVAAVIDGGSIFKNATYFLEGDGPLIFTAYDKIMSLFHFIQNPQWPNVDSVIDSILANHEAQDINQRQITFKNHALGVVRPGFEYFKSKFDYETGELAPQMQLLKVARLCHPIRLRELRPPAEQLDELFQFKVIPMSQCRV